MDENNQNPYAEQNYKPQKPRKPGKGFGIASIVLDIFVWSFFVIMSIVKRTAMWWFEAPDDYDIYILAPLAVCGTLALFAVFFGVMQNIYYENMKMAIVGIVMGVLYLIFPIIQMILLMIGISIILMVGLHLQ